MALIRIPIMTGEPSQQLDTSLNDFPVSMRVKWNERFNFWSLDINDRESTPILLNIRLVTNFPLIKKFALSQFEGELILVQMSGLPIDPDINALGNTHQLIYITADDEVLNNASI